MPGYVPIISAFRAVSEVAEPKSSIWNNRKVQVGLAIAGTAAVIAAAACTLIFCPPAAAAITFLVKGVGLTSAIGPLAAQIVGVALTTLGITSVIVGGAALVGLKAKEWREAKQRRELECGTESPSKEYTQQILTDLSERFNVQMDCLFRMRISNFIFNFFGEIDGFDTQLNRIVYSETSNAPEKLKALDEFLKSRSS